MRLASCADVEQVASILDEAAEWLHSRGIRQWPVRAPREMVADRICRRECYLAWDGDDVVGTLTVQRSDPDVWGDQPPDALYLRGLAVRRVHAGRGRELLEWAERAAGGAGRRYVRLGCMAANVALRAYYERAGYQYRGDRRDADGWLESLYEKSVPEPA